MSIRCRLRLHRWSAWDGPFQTGVDTDYGCSILHVRRDCDDCPAVQWRRVQ